MKVLNIYRTSILLFAFFTAFVIDTNAQGITPFNNTGCFLIVQLVEGTTCDADCNTVTIALRPGQAMDTSPTCGRWTRVNYFVGTTTAFFPITSFGVTFNPTFGCGTDVNGNCGGGIINHNWSFVSPGNFEINFN